jgi:hypothetical protein
MQQVGDAEAGDDPGRAHQEVDLKFKGFGVGEGAPEDFVDEMDALLLPFALIVN